MLTADNVVGVVASLAVVHAAVLFGQTVHLVVRVVLVGCGGGQRQLGANAVPLKGDRRGASNATYEVEIVLLRYLRQARDDREDRVAQGL